jgi:lipopolysaccharide biosynthesis glycosyltransferase
MKGILKRKKHMNKENNIPVFFAVDDCYIPFLAVTITSLIEHASHKNHYDLKVLFTSISEENKAKIKKYERENVSIEFVDLNEHLERIQSKFYTRDYFSQTTYYRLFIPDIFTDLDKALYLDSDTVILDDIANLYNIYIGDNLVGAVPDGAVQSVKEFQDYVELVIGMASYKNYFNAGILLMNLKALRDFRFRIKFLYLLDTIKFKVAQDQDYLNRLCKGRTTIIDSSWNVMPAATSKNRAEVPKLIHYNLSNKPWHLDNIPYEEYFWEYAKKTEFYDLILKIKSEFTENQKQADIQTGLRLVELAQKEADCVGDDRNYNK